MLLWHHFFMSEFAVGATSHLCRGKVNYVARKGGALMPCKLRILFPMILNLGNRISLLQKCTSEIELKPYNTILRIVLVKVEEYHTKSSRHYKYLPCGCQLWFLFLDAPSLKPKKTVTLDSPLHRPDVAYIHSETSAESDVKQPETTVFYEPFGALRNLY